MSNYKYVYIVLQLIAINVINAQNKQCANNNARCISVHQCAPVLNLILQSRLNQGVVNYLRQLQCGFEQSNVKVCCPEEIEVITTLNGDIKPESIIEGTELPDKNHPLLPGRAICGIHMHNNRILGGENVDLEEFPWMALLVYETPQGRGFHCGGSLINNRYVLTAAHCIKNIPPDWKVKRVRLGEHTLGKELDCENYATASEYCADSPLDLDIEERIVHTLYHPRNKNHGYDIALLRLNQTVNFTDFVRPACLSTPSSNFTLKNNSLLTVVGWGLTENSSLSDVKLKTQIPLMSSTECFSIYKRGQSVLLNDTIQFCAGGVKGKDSCRGDSGGPLMAADVTDLEENWVIIGVVSFGVGCGVEGYPGVYTNVSAHNQWIIDNLRP